MNVLITGVSGFAGSFLTRHFNLNRDITLFGHSRNYGQTKEKFRDLSIEMIRSYSREEFNSLEIDCIIHLAGIAHDLSNRYTEEDYLKVNFEYTRLIYDEFLHSNASRFIFVSSIKAVVDHADGPVTENHGCKPSTPYGRSKLLAEEYIRSHPLSPRKEWYVLRPCMIHGPGNKGNLNLLYRYVKTGLPYPLGAFENHRSFLSADNLAFFLEHILKGRVPSGIYNLSDTGTLSTRTVVGLIATALNKPSRIWNLPPSIMRLVFSLYNKKVLHKLTENMIVPNDKLVTILQSQPPVSIEEGIIRTIRSFS